MPEIYDITTRQNQRSWSHKSVFHKQDHSDYGQELFRYQIIHQTQISVLQIILILFIRWVVYMMIPSQTSGVSSSRETRDGSVQWGHVSGPELTCPQLVLAHLWPKMTFNPPNQSNQHSWGTWRTRTPSITVTFLSSSKPKDTFLAELPFAPMIILTSCPSTTGYYEH